jgi:hypothetical protein
MIMRKCSPVVRHSLFGVVALVTALVALASPALAGPGRAMRPWTANPASSQRSNTTLVPSNDTCAGAIVIPCGTFNLAGDTSTANNDYTFPSDAQSCTGFIENGRDVVYRMSIMAGDSLWMDFNSATTDGAIYVVTNCSNPSTSCVVGADSTDVGGKEILRYKFTASGTYYMIIDSFGDNVGGPWNATGQLRCVVQPPPPSNDHCNTATPIPCGNFAFNGSTEFATNDYQFPDVGSSCFGSKAEGKDVAYKLVVAAGDSVWANYNSSTDGAIYLIADCADPVGTCVVGADNVAAGQTELIRYRFNFGGTYYLIADSKALNSFGTFTLTGAYVCPQPPKNDICEVANPIACGNFSLSGSTQLAADNYTFDTDEQSCTGYRAAGRDVVYLVYATVGDSLSMDYHTTADGSVYILADCNNPNGSCVAGEDSAGINETETLRYKFTQTGTYYIILDSFGTGTYGTWTAVGKMTCKRTGVDDGLVGNQLALGAPMPNPFRTSTSIPFALPQRGTVTVRLIDLQGRVVRTLADAEFSAGNHEIHWDGHDDQGALVRAGVYFVKLVTHDGTAMRRAVFVR